MKDSSLIINAKIQIQKPVQEVFEAIVDPARMSNYFISKSNGRMEEGKELIWQFPEFDMKVPVRVGKVEVNKYVSYFWGDDKSPETKVEMELESMKGNSTLVKITEGVRENNNEGIKWLKGNTEGWANFLACLKGWIEYGINLRKNAFDMSQMPDKKA